MSVDLKVTHYDTGEDYFTFMIDRSVTYDFNEYELSQISCMYLQRCLIKYLDNDDEDDHAKEVAENTKKAIEFLIHYGTLSNPKKGVANE